jgi:hypothetical protein
MPTALSDVEVSLFLKNVELGGQEHRVQTQQK